MFDRLKHNAIAERDYALIVPFFVALAFFTCCNVPRGEWATLPGGMLLLFSPLIPGLFYGRFAALVAGVFYFGLVECLVLEMLLQFEPQQHTRVLIGLAIYGWPTAVIVVRHIRDWRANRVSRLV